jgi:gamma-glutamyl-gamma-aminobutyrate hydrolase PuuD
MRILLTPRFERSIHGSFWYAFERDLVDLVRQSFSEQHMVLLTPEIEISISDSDVLFLSGGSLPGENQKRDEFEIGILKEAMSRKASVIGICRGAQLLSLVAGCTLKEVDGHINADRELLGFRTMGRCFHKYAISQFDLDEEWQVLARDAVDRTIEIFRHREFNVLGIMSHPERHKHGLSLMSEIRKLLNL